MSLTKKLINGGIWSAIGQWSRKLIGFAVFTMIARTVSKDTLGLAALAVVYITFLQMIAKQGLGMSIIQSKKLSDEKLNTAFAMSFITATSLALISVVFAEPISKLLGDVRLAPIIVVLAIAAPFRSLGTVPIALQTRNFKFKDIAFQSFIATAVSGVVAVSMALNDFEVWALVAQYITFSLVNTGVVLAKTKWRPNLLFSRSEALILNKFGGKILISDLLGFARSRTDQIIVGIASGPAGLGLYAVGQKLGQTLQAFISAPSESIFLPAFSRMQNNKQRLAKALKKAVRLNTLLIAPTFTGLAVLSPETIQLVFSERWSPAALVCSIFSIQILIGSLFFFNKNLLISQGHPGTFTLLQSVQAVVTIAAIFAGMPWGIEGIASATAISTALLSCLGCMTVQKRIGINMLPIVLGMAPPVLASTFMAFAIHQCRSHAAITAMPLFIQILILSAIGAIIYITLIAIFSRDLLEEFIGLLRNYFLEKKRKGEIAENPQFIEK